MPVREQVIVKDRRELYRGRQFTFAAENVVLPNSREAEFGIVHHPGSTAIVPMMDDQSVLMTLQYRYPVEDYLLEVPAGTMEPGESAMECAKRELEEETGFIADEFEEIATVYLSPAYSDEKAHIFLARALRLSTQRLDDDEIIYVIRYPLDVLVELIAEGRITDALTTAALYRAHMRLH